MYFGQGDVELLFWTLMVDKYFSSECFCSLHNPRLSSIDACSWYYEEKKWVQLVTMLCIFLLIFVMSDVGSRNVCVGQTS